jgi:hypothetical protein
MEPRRQLRPFLDVIDMILPLAAPSRSSAVAATAPFIERGKNLARKIVRLFTVRLRFIGSI